MGSSASRDFPTLSKKYHITVATVYLSNLTGIVVPSNYSLSLSLSSLEFSKFLVSRIFRFEFSKVPQGAFFAFVPSLATRERETPGRVGAETDSSGITGSREREPERAHTRPPSCSFHKRVYGAGG